jgi:hypothetical protein
VSKASFPWFNGSQIITYERPEGFMTHEQKKLQADLIAQYGEVIYKQAVELSGLSLCLVALAADELAAPQREHLYRQASMHLAQLLETLMAPAVTAKVSECAKRMDAALDTWMLDEIEKRDGLPYLKGSK